MRAGDTKRGKPENPLRELIKTNAALLVGHTTLRVATMDDLGQPASAAQIGQMRALVQEAMEAGAVGVSTGLFYEPSVAAPTEEVIAVCKPLKEFDGVYCTHMRNEAEGVIDSRLGPPSQSMIRPPPNHPPSANERNSLPSGND